jgi:hypothetical protein
MNNMHVPHPHPSPPFQLLFFRSPTVAAVCSNLLLPRFCAFANGRCRHSLLCLQVAVIHHLIISRVFSCSNTTNHLRARISNFDRYCCTRFKTRSAEFVLCQVINIIITFTFQQRCHCCQSVKYAANSCSCATCWFYSCIRRLLGRQSPFFDGVCKSCHAFKGCDG